MYNPHINPEDPTVEYETLRMWVLDYINTHTLTPTHLGTVQDFLTYMEYMEPTPTHDVWGWLGVLHEGVRK